MTPPTSPTDPEWDHLKQEFNTACLQSAQSARVQIAHELNQLFRRFRQYEKEADWVRLVMEGAKNYARQSALFALQGETLKLRGAVNIELSIDLTLEIKSVAAFNAVLRSKEPVTALRTYGEVGAALSTPGKLAYLFPILNGSRVVAILFANAEESEVDQLELVADMASSALERQNNSSMHSQIVSHHRFSSQRPCLPHRFRRYRSQPHQSAVYPHGRICGQTTGPCIQRPPASLASRSPKCNFSSPSPAAKRVNRANFMSCWEKR